MKRFRLSRHRFKKTLQRLLSAALAAAALSVPSPRALYGWSDGAAGRGVFFRCDNDQMKIALTFDDGPHPCRTVLLLDFLAEYKIPATFFVIGMNISFTPDIVARELAEGHEVGNHTFGHNKLAREGCAELKAELLETEKVILEDCGYEYKTKLFRPPEGFISEDIEALAAELDYTIVLWSIDTLDWQHKKASVIAAEVLDSVEAGDIILMHDYVGGEWNTLDALRIIVPELLRRGYKFVTVSELLGISG